MYYVGIDIGGTGIQIGLVNEEGVIVERGAIVTRLEDGWAHQIADMAACAKDVIERSGVSMDEVASIGVGVPGLSDQKTGNVIFCTNLGWHDVPYRTEFQKYIDKPVYIDNDATVAGLAESVAGVSAGTSSSIMLTLGTGVGGGIVINNKVWNGFHGTGSEIGHTILVAGGEQCTCGNKGCLERYCSATAMIRMARTAVAANPSTMILEKTGNDPMKINAKIIVDCARDGDPVAVQVFREYISYLGQAIASISNFMDPEMVVLGGGVSKAGDILIDAVREETKKYVLFKGQPYSHIELARLGPDAGIIGAAMLGK